MAQPTPTPVPDQDESLRPLSCWQAWLADHSEEHGLGAVVFLQDGMTAWSGHDGTLPRAVDAWLDHAEEHVREHSSLGEDDAGWPTTKPHLVVLVDAGSRWDVVRVSPDRLDRLIHHLRTDLGLELPPAFSDVVAYVICWAAQLSVQAASTPAAAATEQPSPRLPRYRPPPAVANPVAPGELVAWARGLTRSSFRRS